MTKELTREEERKQHKKRYKELGIEKKKKKDEDKKIKINEKGEMRITGIGRVA